MNTHRLIVGDTLKPLGRTLIEGDIPADLTGKTVQFEMYDEAGNPVVERTADNVTVEPPRTFVIDTSNGWLYSVGHHAREGQQVTLTTTGSFDGSGLAMETRYFVVGRAPNTFKLALVPGGDPVNLTEAGEGTHSFSIAGSVQYDFQVVDVASPGTMRAWFSVHDGSEFYHFPNDEQGIEVVISELP